LHAAAGELGRKTGDDLKEDAVLAKVAALGRDKADNAGPPGDQLSRRSVRW